MDREQLADEAALRHLITRYAQCADRRDAKGFSALFAPGAVLSALGRAFDTPEALAAIPPSLSIYVKTYHTLYNYLFEIDGDEARGEVYSMAHHLTPTPDGKFNDYAMTITYRDRYKRTGGRWQFARREVQIEWAENRIVEAHA